MLSWQAYKVNTWRQCCETVCINGGSCRVVSCYSHIVIGTWLKVINSKHLARIRMKDNIVRDQMPSITNIKTRICIILNFTCIRIGFINLYSITKEDIGQWPLDQVSRLRPTQVLFRASKSVSAGPDGSVPEVFDLIIGEAFPGPKLLTANMYSSYSVPHLNCNNSVRNPYTSATWQSIVKCFVYWFSCCIVVFITASKWQN